MVKKKKAKKEEEEKSIIEVALVAIVDSIRYRVRKGPDLSASCRRVVVVHFS